MIARVGRPGIVRAGLAVMAAVVAGLAAWTAGRDDSMFASGAVAALNWLLAILALGVALLSVRVTWTDVRLVRLGAFVVLSILPMWVLAALSGARAACACGASVVPTAFGIIAHDWVTLAAITYPLALGAVASPLPDRLRRRDTP